MPDVHLPKVHSTSFWHLLLEVLLISVGVFLGLFGEQWRQTREHRETARQSLERLATELRANEAAVKAVSDYHAKERPLLQEYFAADTAARRTRALRFDSIRPARFQHSAWNLAIATQSLVYIDPALAGDLSKVYEIQDDYEAETNSLVQALFVPQNALALAGANREGGASDAFLSAALIYFNDLSFREPQLIALYDDLRPRIDRALAR